MCFLTSYCYNKVEMNKKKQSEEIENANEDPHFGKVLCFKELYSHL